MRFQKSKDRRRGFIESHKRLGLNCDEDCIYVTGKLSDVAEELDFDRALEHLVGRQGVKSIIALNDIFAIHTINALSRMGVSVPQDVSVIGCDNIQFASMFNPALTTIDQKQDELSKRAVNMLLDMIEGDKGEPRSKHDIIKPELVVRESA